MTMKKLTGTAGRPYPNVQAWVRADGSVTYEAQYQHRNRKGRPVGTHLGTWDNPLRAHYEVVNARANAAEKRARDLRAEADEILATLCRRRELGAHENQVR